MDYIKTMLEKCIPMSKQEQMNVLERYSNGEKQLKDKIINSNLRFVFQLALSYNNADFEDVFMAGVEALCLALENFNFEKFNKNCTSFLSYASKIIKQKMFLIGKNGSVHYLCKKKNFDDLLFYYRDKEKVKKIMNIVNDTTVKNFELSLDTRSLNEHIEDGVEFIDVLEKDYDPENETETKMILSKLDFTGLKNDEKFILKSVFYENKSLQKIGKILKVSKETVRQRLNHILENFRQQLGLKTAD